MSDTSTPEVAATGRVLRGPALAVPEERLLTVPQMLLRAARTRGGESRHFELTGDAAKGQLGTFLRREDDHG